jgi:hypothetical protein
MAIESLVRKKYFLTSEQSECFASLSIGGAKYVITRTVGVLAFGSDAQLVTKCITLLTCIENSYFRRKKSS